MRIAWQFKHDKSNEIFYGDWITDQPESIVKLTVALLNSKFQTTTKYWIDYNKTKQV